VEGFRPLSSLPIRHDPILSAGSGGLVSSFCGKQKDSQTASPVPLFFVFSTRIEDWLVPSKKADDSVAEQYAGGVSSVGTEVQWWGTGYGWLFALPMSLFSCPVIY
jgi:hypothetical protein